MRFIKFLSPSSSTATVEYLGPNNVLIANNGSETVFPIMAYSTTDNTSLTYEIRFNPVGISLAANNLTVAPGTPVGQYFVDVSIISIVTSSWATNLPNLITIFRPDYVTLRLANHQIKNLIKVSCFMVIDKHMT